MDSNGNIKLFNTDQDNVAMPSIGVATVDEQSALISESIEEAISGEQVKTLILPEDSEIAPLNYIFDFSDVQSINKIQQSALKALVARDGDVQLYLYRKQGGLTAFGEGNKYVLERMIPLIRHHVFNNEIKIYKNFAVGQEVEEVFAKDITKMRLNL